MPSLDDLIHRAMNPPDPPPNEAARLDLDQALQRDFPELYPHFTGLQIHPPDNDPHALVATFLFDSEQGWYLQRIDTGSGGYKWYLSYPNRPTREQFDPEDAQPRVLKEMGAYREAHPRDYYSH